MVIGSGVTDTGTNVFSDCYYLTKVTISEGVTVIKNYSFAYCDSLTDISLPSTIEEIGASAFARTYALKVINFNGSKSDWEKIEKHDRWSAYIEVCTIRCTDGDIVVEDYRLDA